MVGDGEMTSSYWISLYSRMVFIVAVFLISAFRIAPKQLIFEQKRFRGRINIQKPRKPHYTRQLVSDFLTPFYINPNKGKPLVERCQNVTAKSNLVTRENPHQKIVERMCLELFTKSRMVAFFHQNPISGEDQFELKVPLFRANMHYKAYGRKIIQNALSNTPYEAASVFTTSYTSLVFSPEINVPRLTKIVKKFPQLVLMGGILDGRLLHLEDFLKYGELDLTQARVGLVHVLQNAGGNNLNRQLTHHQTTLVTRLKQIGEENETATSEKDEPAPA